MKLQYAAGTMLLACGSLLAQSNPTSSSSGQSGSTSGTTNSTQKSAGMQQHMQQMQADMQQMKSQIDKMRADAQKVQDTNTKTALLDNADTWDQFLSRMQSHMQMMQNMHQGGMGAMHHKRGAGTSSSANPK